MGMFDCILKSVHTFFLMVFGMNGLKLNASKGQKSRGSYYTMRLKARHAVYIKNGGTDIHTLTIPPYMHLGTTLRKY